MANPQAYIDSAKAKLDVRKEHLAQLDLERAGAAAAVAELEKKLAEVTAKHTPAPAKK